MKLKRIAFIIAVFMLFVSAAAFAVLYRVGDRIADELIEQLLTFEAESEPDTGTAALQQQGDATMAHGIPPAPENEPAPIEPPKQPSGSSTLAKQPSDMPSGQKDRGEETGPIAAAGFQISRERIEEIKGEVTAEDKMSMTAMVLKKLSQQDVERLIKMAAGGITADEKKEMKKLALERFTAEEINEIKKMYDKYLR
ncbi:MAG: hypothetical protein VB106_04345 [Clostridiaceae bacterium]|nr:hypothetical protein [Clostridiaceae bacterium]